MSTDPSNRHVRCAAWSLAAVAASFVVPWLVVFAYMDRPPPGHTGGFDEPSCHQCHFDNPINDAAGSVILGGIPDVYTAGNRYRITVTLARPGMKRGGFQLSVRFLTGPREGQQAGALDSLDGRVAVVEGEDDKVRYAVHMASSSSSSPADEIGWTLRWIAPESSDAPVVFHLAANAANSDDSEFGDFVYTKEAVSASNRLEKRHDTTSAPPHLDSSGSSFRQPRCGWGGDSPWEERDRLCTGCKRKVD